MAYPIDAILGPVSVFKVPVANTDGTTPQEGDVLYRDTNGNPQWGSSAVVARSLVQLANLAAIQAQATISRTKVYVAADTGKQYMWTGEGAAGNWTVAEVNAGLALGETSATAYRGDRGKTAYDHSQAIATAAEFVAGTDKTKNATVGFLKDATALDGFWLTRRTKMPDGATAVYSQDAWVTTDGWTTYNGTLSVSSTPGSLRFTATDVTFPGVSKAISGILGKIIVLRYKTNFANSSAKLVLHCNNGTIYLGYLSQSPIPQIVSYVLPAYFANQTVGAYISIPTVGDWFEIDWIWVGDYSYLTGTMSEEAAQIANQLGDSAGVGVAASGTITSNGTVVSNNDTVTVAGKVYTFKTVLTPTEGEVLIGADAQTSLANLAAAINRTDPGTNDGVKYKIAAAHPLVSASATDLVLTVTALQTGELGNQITLAKSAATLTLSGSTLTGGYSATAKKLATLAAPIIAGNGTRPAAALIDITDTSKIGYEDAVDVASGGTVTLPSGGTWLWFVYGYGATISGAKRGISAGGTVLTVSGANATVWYRRYA